MVDKIEIATDAYTFLGGPRRGEVLCTDNGKILVGYFKDATGDGFDHLYVAESTDLGATWASSRVADATDSGWLGVRYGALAIQGDKAAVTFGFEKNVGGLFERMGLAYAVYSGGAWGSPIVLIEPTRAYCIAYYPLVQITPNGDVHVICAYRDYDMDDPERLGHWVNGSLTDITGDISCVSSNYLTPFIANGQLYIFDTFDAEIYRYASGSWSLLSSDDSDLYAWCAPSPAGNEILVPGKVLYDDKQCPSFTIYDVWDDWSGVEHRASDVAMYNSDGDVVCVSKDVNGVSTLIWPTYDRDAFWYRQWQNGDWLAAKAELVTTVGDGYACGSIAGLTESGDLDSGFCFAFFDGTTLYFIAEDLGEVGYGTPEIQTDAATAVDDDDATLNGTVIDDLCGAHGCYTLFQYGKSTAEADLSRTDHCGAPTKYNETDTFSKDIATLENPGVLYVFRAAGLSCAGWNWDTYWGIGLGRWRTFISDEDHPDLDGANAPTVTTEDATDVVGRAATLNGTLTDDGGANKCVCFFIWGRRPTAAAIEGWENITPSALCVDDESFDHDLSDLMPNTQYHFRAVAWNDEGYAFGDDKTFWTESPMEDGANGAIGLVGSIRHEWEPGSYRLTIGLGGLGKAITTIPNLDANVEGDPQLDSDIPTEPTYPSTVFPGDISDEERQEHYNNVYGSRCLSPSGMPGEVRVIGGQTAMCLDGRWQTGAALISQGVSSKLTGKSTNANQRIQEVEAKLTRALERQAKRTSAWSKGKHSPYGTAYSPSFYWHHRFKGIFMPIGGASVAGGAGGGSGYASLIPELNRWRHEIDILTWMGL